MLFPEQITIGRFTISVLAPLIVLSLFFATYVFWTEGKKDGFKEESLFDLFFSSVLMTGAAYWFLTYLISKNFIIIDANLAYFTAFLVGLMPFFFIPLKWGWSYFRILDIASLSYCVGSAIILFGYYVVGKNLSLLAPAGVLLIFYLIFSRLRRSKIKSGITFFFFTLAGLLLGYFYFKPYSGLIFYISLITMGIVVLYLRERKNFMDTKLPLNFINALKDKLTKKEKRLKSEQKILIQEDPYLNKGRDTDNSELMDEALLEDVQKEIIDSKKSLNSSMLIQVKKALAKIKIGRYGICEVCKKPIEQARLEAFPEATTCVEHAGNPSAK